MATKMSCLVSHNFNRVAISLLTNEGIEAALRAIYIALAMEK
jgi:hypothetical protein